MKSVFGVAAILTLLLLIQGVQAACDPGWDIKYYPDQTWSGSPTTDTPVYIHFAGPTTPLASDIADWPASISGFGRYQDFSMTADGYVDIATAGEYTFSTVSDDGVEVWVDGVLEISDTGDHGPTTDYSSPITLSTGFHHIVLKYRENTFNADPFHTASGNVAVIYLEYINAAGTAPVLVPGCHMTGTNAPEFPSAFVPATMLIGVLGTVLLLRRIK